MTERCRDGSCEFNSKITTRYASPPTPEQREHALASAYQSRDLCLEQGQIDLAIRWQEEIERMEGLESPEPPRADIEVWCPLRMRNMLILNNICFSRTRDRDCRLCRFDNEFILVRLVWEVLDFWEDREENP
jgi:hypothetical protein